MNILMIQDEFKKVIDCHIHLDFTKFDSPIVTFEQSVWLNSAGTLSIFDNLKMSGWKGTNGKDV